MKVRAKDKISKDGLKIKKNQDKLRKKKLIFAGILFSLTLTFLFGKVFYIKTIYGKEYEKAAIDQDFNTGSNRSVITAIRGSIVDREQKSLAISAPVDDIILDVRYLSELKEKESKPEIKAKYYEETVKNLNKYLGIPVETINGYVQLDANHKLKPEYDTHYMKIAEDVDRAISTSLLDSGVKHVYAEQDSKRSYVYGDLAASTIGFIRGNIKLGIEQYYDKALSGINGKVFKTYDDDNNPVISKEDAENGNTIVTTIDSTIQQFAEEASIEVGEKYQAENTGVIVMNPKNGEILAMAQYTSFDNNDPANIEKITNTNLKNQLSGLTHEAQLKELDKIWTNFNISNSFEPGSIFKPIVVAAALEEGLITEDSTFHCDGGQDLYGTYIPCWKTSGHGTQNVTQILKNSCNDGMMQIVQKMGNEIFYKYQRDFGYGQITGIDLPGEMSSSALMYSVEELKNPVNLATSSMGQGFNNTPIQAINAFAAIVNGGSVVRPHVVSQIVDSEGNIILENSGDIQNKVISSETSDAMRISLNAVVSPSGTGHKAIIEGYNIGGKTGTAQQGSRDKEGYAVSFIGYLPVEDPEIMVMTLINKPKEYLEGSTSATPMARELMVKIINYSGIQPSGDTTTAKDITLEEGTIVLEDLTGMNLADVTSYLNNNGLDYELVGVGGNIVGTTVPKGGTNISSGSRVYIYFQDGESMEKLVLVPDVTNISVKEATKLLTDIGLVPVNYNMDRGNSNEDATEEQNSDKNKEQTDDSLENEKEGKTVVEQMPKAETYVPTGTEIKLKVN